MTNERKLELSLLLQITERLPYSKEENKFAFLSKKYNGESMINRIHELVSEFLEKYEEPYVTDSAEKSE